MNTTKHLMIDCETLSLAPDALADCYQQIAELATALGAILKQNK